MVTGNATRQRINVLKAQEFGKTHDKPILFFYDGLSMITDRAILEKLSRMLRLRQPIKCYFVQGAPVLLTQNVPRYVPMGLVNSARCTMRSLT